MNLLALAIQTGKNSKVEKKNKKNLSSGLVWRTRCNDETRKFNEKQQQQAQFSTQHDWWEQKKLMWKICAENFYIPLVAALFFALLPILQQFNDDNVPTQMENRSSTSLHEPQQCRREPDKLLSK
jgi:hypothetical protein